MPQDLSRDNAFCVLDDLGTITYCAEPFVDLFTDIGHLPLTALPDKARPAQIPQMPDTTILQSTELSATNGIIPNDISSRPKTAAIIRAHPGIEAFLSADPGVGYLMPMLPLKVIDQPEACDKYRRLCRWGQDLAC